MDLYINRMLHIEGQLVHDRALLQHTGVIVVLAEPGAGKTEFLKFLARNLGVSPVLATIFPHTPIPPHTTSLVIDALDEVARIDEAGTNAILVKARDSGATTVILASRSYVWDEARTQFARDCFGLKPIIVRLEPFDEDEQRRLFEDRFLGEDFAAFRHETERFELTPLLGNPQFLQLLADAYVEGGRRFKTKGQIYVDAVNRLASERTNAVSQRNRPPTDAIVDGACEIFAKLLLSGAAGVSTSDEIGDADYPYLQFLGAENTDVLPFVLNTRLLKPTALIGKHEPVHRIVAEYCAARYLVSRIEDPSNVLSLRRCLAVIAPNAVVRDELRGMLGWMASLGTRAIQEAVIDLDPYAVFANGDPSHLVATSKRRLLRGLEALANVDPYFRRMDAWRRFSVAGFFTDEIVDDVRRLLRVPDNKSHLRGLLLELLQGSPAALALGAELRAVLLDSNAGSTTRLLAHRTLIVLPEHNHVADFDALVSEGSADSLKIASEMVAKEGVAFFGESKILALLSALTKLYPTGDKRDRTFASRHFIRQLISLFSAADVRVFLEVITGSISCVCSKSDIFRCECRKGGSKIAGLLLDRYFEAAWGPHDPRRIAAWTSQLVFRSSASAESSPSVKVLGSDDGLRQAVHRVGFEGLITPTEIREAGIRFYFSQCHSGLMMRAGDVRALVDYAFTSGNVLLWSNFFAWHNPYADPKGVNELRARMREQARRVPEFLRVWSGLDRGYRRSMRKDYPRRTRSRKKFNRAGPDNTEARLDDLRRNRDQIESGMHWGWLQNFAMSYLYEPDELEKIDDYPQIAEKALLNCFPFLSPHVPSLDSLSDGRGSAVAQVLHAACLATFREKSSLDGIDIEVLRAVKTDSGGGPGYRDGEEKAFEAELDRLLFLSKQDALDYATRYIEPQLLRAHDAATQVHFLDHKSAFESVKGALALDWLTRYPEMPFSTMDTLFNIVAQYGDRTALNDLIATRCNDMAASSDIAQRRRKFWLLRHFFFITPASDALWAEYSVDPKAIFAIEYRAGRFFHDDSVGWPVLSAEKVYRVLDAFVTAWPKVNLPSSWGTGDPEEETAYRFLSEVIHQIGRDDPSVSIPVCDRILSDQRFLNYENDIRSLKTASARKQAISGFSPPKPREILKLLDENKIASVEDLRALLVELLGEIQVRLKGAATDPLDVFYPDGKRVDENSARNRIVDMLEDRLNALNLAVVIEHHMANSNRCDLTASTSVNQRPILLVTEVKGQWNAELYTAASAQLADRYMVYPGAAQQGIYLVLWFGGDETIGGKRNPTVTTPIQLRTSIIEAMPAELREAIDVVVLDLSRPSAPKNTPGSKKPPRKAKASPTA